VRPIGPRCVALVTCDGIVIDPSTGKPSLVGVFHHLSASRFPVIIAGRSIWIELAGGSSPAALRLRFTGPSAQGRASSCLAERPLRVAFSDPGPIEAVHVPFPTVLVPVAGEYTVELIADGVAIMSRPVSVIQAPRKLPPWHES